MELPAIEMLTVEWAHRFMNNIVKPGVEGGTVFLIGW